MTHDINWNSHLELDVRYGYLGRDIRSPRRMHPQLVLNGPENSALRAIRAELKRCREFTFSVAFVSPQAIALLKQELVEFAENSGCAGRIITSDYLGFNSPRAFSELYNLRRLGIDVRLHSAKGFHPKGYIFVGDESVTAMVGSSNLTASALTMNHEWNLRVSASPKSDLAHQIDALVADQLASSVPITLDWIADYSASYKGVSGASRGRVPDPDPDGAVEVAAAIRAGERSGDLGQTALDVRVPRVIPNEMQREALAALDAVRRDGKNRAIVISATGTGKTILSALDVRAANPRKLLFVVHREQILDRTIVEYQKVLGAPESEFGKLAGPSRSLDKRYVFATVQTLSRPEVLSQVDPREFEYVIIDEAHRAGSPTYQRVLDHLQPGFLLGMTATPERTDGFNVFELFDFNVPYEIRLSHALEAGMLSAFHYYGIADAVFEDGSTASAGSDLRDLISANRVAHLIDAIETYGQAGVPPRGLIFCSRKDEARELSGALNNARLRGAPLRTVALTGDDSIEHREAMVRRLEDGDLDYILTVDVFNEGVDIPTVNQVIMLRQTKSAIVFVQQLGRGLRKANNKEYLVVIDFIGNYANNYLIPIALFGDESLNRESLRQQLISAEEVGVLPGLSSVRFDRISQERVLSSIVETKLDSLANLKNAIEGMRNRLGQPPRLWDFFRFESVDPVVLATAREHYPALLDRVLKTDHRFDPPTSRALQFLSHEVLPAKRLHEFVLWDYLVNNAVVTRDGIAAELRRAGLPATLNHVQGVLESFTLSNHSEADRTRYGQPVVAPSGDGYQLTDEVRRSLENDSSFAEAVEDLIRTGRALTEARYIANRPFTPGRQYSRKDTMRLLNAPRRWVSTLYGYKVDRERSACAIFVTLHKSDDIAESTAYDDELLGLRTMRWFTRSKRTLQSNEVIPIINNQVDLHVFVQKDDADDFFYLGQATASDAEQTTIPSKGRHLSIVKMLLTFDAPIPAALFDYFHPMFTA